MSRKDPQIMLRLPEPLKEWLKGQAIKNHRSQNAEIVYRLEQSKALQEAA